MLYRVLTAILAVFLTSCEPMEKVDFQVKNVQGVNSGKVKSILENFARAKSENMAEIEYEILNLPMVFDQFGNNKFQNLLISITVKSGQESVSEVMNYRFLSFDDWKYDEVLYEAIARKIVAMEMIILAKNGQKVRE